MLIRFLSVVVCSGLVFAVSPSTAPALAYSTYLRDGFTPSAITTDSVGNIYIAGTVVIDAETGQRTALVMKLNPQASQYLYLRYLGGSVRDLANAIAVDGAGNAYIAGETESPDFPVTPGGIGTPFTSTTDVRSFVAKLDSTGNIIFSDLLGGSARSSARAVAVTASGQVIVSGISNSGAFPSTAGAYSVPNNTYLLEVDSTGTKLVFSAAGIGGSAIALDPSGNIYVAGTSYLLGYPTTPGSYQPVFPAFTVCAGITCEIINQGANQYVTKVDPTGSKLIYATAISGTGNTSNAGLAVDKAGNAYVTGLAGSGYPYTVTPPALGPRSDPIIITALPFLSKLDPSGQTLLFSVPVGGSGVQVDSAGAVYVGGRIGLQPDSVGGYEITAKLPNLAGVPAPCLPNGLTIQNVAYGAQVDAVSGNVLATQFIGGSTLNPSAVALTGSILWVAGATTGPDVPFTPNVLSSGYAGAGAYLGAVDFSQPQPAAGMPQIGCVLDAADLSPVGPVGRYQLLSIFGTGLGPAVGVGATDNKTTSLAGVTVTFGTFPAILLYVSSTQINLAVPLITYADTSTPMRVTVSGISGAARQLPLTGGASHLFLNLAETYPVTANPNRLFFPLTLNADGSVNSSANPAVPGSTVSVFVNGLAPDPQITSEPLDLYAVRGWKVTNVAQVTPFVVRVDAQPPSGCPISACASSLTLFDSNGEGIGPPSGASMYVSH